MARYFRKCKQVTAGFGGAGFLTGIVVTLGLLLPLYQDTENFKLAKTVAFTINNPTNVTTLITSRKSISTMKAVVANTKQYKATEIASITCKLTQLGFNYRGYVNITREGILCQHWIDDYPHR